MLQYQDQDSKIREYVLKKKQQKDRASKLREQRRKKEYLTEEEATTSYRKRTRKNSARRIIADPFAPRENNNYTNTQIIKPQHRTTPLPSYNNNPVNDPNVHKLLSTISECQSHIKELQHQVRDLQFEIQELKQNQHNQQNNMQYNTQQNYFNQDQNLSSHPNNNTRHRRPDIPSTTSSTYRSNAPLQEDYQNPMKKTNMSKSLANLKFKRRQHSAPKINAYPSSRGDRSRRNSRNNPMKAAKIDSNRTSHREYKESAMDFVHKLSQMEDVVQEVERIECHQCGRKFIESALKRHVKICKKVFCKKRKVFDVQRVDKEAKNAQNSDDTNAYKLKKMRSKKKESWKAKSAMLRHAIAASKNVDSGMNGYNATMAPSYDDRVECPHCGRKFAEQTAERHIPKCRDIIAKPKRLRRRY